MVESTPDKKPGVDHITLRCESIIPNVPTANGRVYTPGVMREMVEQNQERIKARTLLGQLGQPYDGKTRLAEVSHVVTGLRFDPELGLEADFRPLDNEKGFELKKALGLVGGIHKVGDYPGGMGAYQAMPAGVGEITADGFVHNYNLSSVNVVPSHPPHLRTQHQHEAHSRRGSLSSEADVEGTQAYPLHEVQRAVSRHVQEVPRAQEAYQAAQEARDNVMNAENRQDAVEALYFMYGCPASVIAKTLDVDETRVRDDLAEIRERLVAQVENCSPEASQVPEEISALLRIAQDAAYDAQMLDFPRAGLSSKDAVEAKARLLDTAARCFFYIGRLKQGRDE